MAHPNGIATSSVPKGLDLDLWCGPAPLAVPVRQKFHYDRHWMHLTGNGDIGNQNPHGLDKARWGLGKCTLPHLANISLALGEETAAGARLPLGTDVRQVVETLDTFHEHLAGQEIDYATTTLRLGRQLAIDAATDRTVDAAVDRLFARERRAGWELPPAS